MSSLFARFSESALNQNGVSNIIPLLVVGLLFWGIVRAGRQPIWAEAYRRLRRNALALAAIVIIGSYGAVAVADSLGWRNNSNAPRRTLLDRAFDARFATTEPTYSPPLGTETVGEPHPHKLRYPGQHLLGTDATGQDVLYLTLKGCRTALLIGGLTQIIVTPLALFFGMAAGYYGKRVDDAIQYLYIVLDSIPSILLLVALLLVLGKGIVPICLALGMTSWVSLCRLVRGETLKHRDREYVRAARSLGVSNTRILTRHILPNLLPLVIISTTLGVSGNILYESILSYLAIGVDPGTGSWGNMVDAARQELTRDPLIWWNLGGAVVATFVLVLAFNILGDALRDAIDPRLRSS